MSQPALTQSSSNLASMCACRTNSRVSMITSPRSRFRGLAWAVGTAPFGDEFLQFRIGLFREHDFERDEFVAPAAVNTGNALALQAQQRAGVRPFRHRHGHGAGRGRHFHLASQDGFAQRDRQFDMDVVALAREEAVWTDLDLDQGIARLAAANTGPALAPKP